MNERRDAVDAWEALYRAQVSVMRHLREHWPSEVSPSEYDLMFNLFRLPTRSARIRDLTANLLITQPSVSRLIDRLAARGLVSKRPDQHDARGTLVALTEQGEALFRRVGALHGRVIADRMLAALSPDELHALGALSDRLRTGCHDDPAEIADPDTPASESGAGALEIEEPGPARAS